MGLYEVENHDRTYQLFLKAVKDSFTLSTKEHQPLFFTDCGEKLWYAYINSFKDPVEKQVHNCRTCRRFFEKFGGLVTIGPGGELSSVMWGGRELRKIVSEGKITFPFYSSEEILGTPQTGPWTHISVVSKKVDYLRAVQINENAKNLMRVLEDKHLVSKLEMAIDMLKSGALHRPEKVLPNAEWLLELTAKRGNRKNLCYLAAATAPDGFCHVNASMLGFLLDEIGSSNSSMLIEKRFNEKMDPLAYQRMQAPPSEGNILAAEKLVKEMGIERSLERRFARIEEMKLLWAPKEEEKDGGVFGCLKKKEKPEGQTISREQLITAVKFMKDIMPNAVQMEVKLPYGVNLPFIAFTSAVHGDAPPILRWDNDPRNRISHYLYQFGSPKDQWGFGTVRFAKVTGAVENPAHWYGPRGNEKQQLTFLLEGSKDSKNRQSALFPESLRAELRPVRSTIEAYSKMTPLQGYESATACGIAAVSSVVVVESASGLKTTYRIDRWD